MIYFESHNQMMRFVASYLGLHILLVTPLEVSVNPLFSVMQ